MKRMIVFFAAMAILAGAAYQAQAQEKQKQPVIMPGDTKSTILAGTIWLDNKCKGENCGSMKFEIYVDSENIGNLQFSDYCPAATYPKLMQMPLELTKELQKIIQKYYPKTVMKSDGESTSFSLFKSKKNMDLLGESTDLMDGIGRAKTKYKIVIEHYASQ